MSYGRIVPGRCSDSIERVLMASVMGGACILGLGWTACTVVPCQLRV